MCVWVMYYVVCHVWLCVQVEKGVWATVLALIWLHGFKMDAQVEWQFVAMKAVTWIRNQKGKLSILTRNH